MAIMVLHQIGEVVGGRGSYYQMNQSHSASSRLISKQMKGASILDGNSNYTIVRTHSKGKWKSRVIGCNNIASGYLRKFDLHIGQNE